MPLKRAASNRNIRHMALILYVAFKLPLINMREEYSLLSRSRWSASNASMQFEVLNVWADAAEKEIMVGLYCGSQETTFQEQHAGRTLSNDILGLLTYQNPLLWVPVNCLLILPQSSQLAALLILISLQMQTHSCTDTETTKNLSTWTSTYSTTAVAE